MMHPRLLALFLVATALGLGGCATRVPMAFEQDTDRVAADSKPVYLMTATVKNTYRTSFQPKVGWVYVDKSGATQVADRTVFTIDDKAKAETNTVEAGNSYLLRLQLDPGAYDIYGFLATARSFPIQGHFFVPLHAPLSVKESGVYYLGHVEATVRERQGNEFKAGPSIPLLDQAVAGASGGTFDIQITDRWTTDEALFRARFPALAGVVVKKAVLPAFDRSKAQRLWEAP